MKLRDDHHGLSLVVTLLDSVLFGPQAKKGAGSDPAVQSQYKVAKSQVGSVGNVATLCVGPYQEYIMLKQRSVCFVRTLKSNI